MLSSQTTDGTGSPVAELHPSGSDYVRRVLPAVPFAALVIGLRVWAVSRSYLVALAVVVGIVVVVTILVLLFLREARWWADPAAVHARGMFGRVRTVGRGDVDTVLLATRFRSGRARPGVFLALRDRTGRGVLRLQGPAWDASAIEQFLWTAGLGPVTRIDEPTDPRSLARLEPGAQSRAAEHPGKVAMITVAVVVGLVVLAFGAGALVATLTG